MLCRGANSGTFFPFNATETTLWKYFCFTVLHMGLYVKMELAGKNAAGLKLPVTIPNVIDFQQESQMRAV